MIEITTLLLGLLVGPRMVEVAAAPQVVSVVFEVDGERVVGLRPQDGRGAGLVDFGPALMPHRLTAVAYDEAGREIGRDDEWINLPRPEIDAQLVLHGDPWAPERASLIWEHLAEEPATVRRAVASLDGRPLAAPDPADIRLPRLDPDVPHVLTLDVTFSNGERIELARAFGGGGIDEVETRLLPFQVATRPGTAWPDDPSAALAECLAAPDGARVHGWEDEAAEVIVVRDVEALPRIDRMVRTRLGRQGRGEMPTRRRYDEFLPLRPGDRLRQVWPVVKRSEHRGLPLNLFPTSHPERGVDRGVVSVLRERQVSDKGAQQRLADAAALAGFVAYGSRRPAVVVVVLDEARVDGSEWTPAMVQTYLDALGVPLHVWSLVGAEPAATGGWGPAVNVATYDHLERAVLALRESLDRQRLVWLAGVALPQDVELSASCACCQAAAD